MGTKDIKTHSLTTTRSQAKQERSSLNKKGANVWDEGEEQREVGTPGWE